MDIDVDVPTSFKPGEIFKDAVLASMLREQTLAPHPCGVYFHTVPVDPLTGLSAVPYDRAEELGWLKVDFLHLSVYDQFSSREEITELLKIEPDWKLLEIPSVVGQLFHLSKHYDLLQEVKPRSIEELADCLALIRPQKRFMLKAYLKNRAKYREELYKLDPGQEGYAFKKAHAIAYALVIVLQLHLIKG